MKYEKISLKERCYLTVIMTMIVFSLVGFACEFTSKFSVEFGGPPLPWPMEFVVPLMLFGAFMGFFGNEIVPFICPETEAEYTEARR